MVKKPALIIFLLVSVACLRAQTYTLSPSKTYSAVAVYNQANSYFINITNTGTSSISLTYGLINMYIPGGWSYSMCDYYTCYTGIPNGPVTLDTLAPGKQYFIVLSIDPFTISGNGTVKMYLYQNGFSSHRDTLTWAITSAAVGIEELSAGAAFALSPNPAKDRLTVSAGSFSPDTRADILNAEGRCLLSVAGDSIKTIDVSGLPAGIYSLLLTSGERRLVRKFVKLQD